MASSSTQELMSVGKQCKHPLCNLVDFLPFKCDHCKESFCQEHFKVDAHSCPKYDEFQHNRVAPDCPFCKIPVSVKPGQDPNERLEQHFVTECSVYAGKSAKKSPLCGRPRCGKVLVSPIRCDKCSKQFCPQHRFPSDHNCTTAIVVASTPQPAKPTQGVRPGGLTSTSRLLNLNVGGSKKPTPAKKPTVVAVASQPKEPAKASSSSNTPNPFSKTESSYRLIVDSIPNTTNNLDQHNKPEPIIKPNSYAPPPVFSIA